MDDPLRYLGAKYWRLHMQVEPKVGSEPKANKYFLHLELFSTCYTCIFVLLNGIDTSCTCKVFNGSTKGILPLKATLRISKISNRSD